MEKTLALVHGHENHSKWKKKRNKMLVGKEASKHNPKSMKKIISIGVFKNIPINGRNEVFLIVLQSLINKFFWVDSDNGSLILNPSLTTTTKLFPFLLQHSETKMKKKTIFPFSSRGKTRPAIFYTVTRCFAEISPRSRKYSDIFSAIYRRYYLHWV